MVEGIARRREWEVGGAQAHLRGATNKGLAQLLSTDITIWVGRELHFVATERIAELKRYLSLRLIR